MNAKFKLLSLMISFECDMERQHLLSMYWRSIVLDDNQHITIAMLIHTTNLHHPRIESYCESWIPKYLERDFFNLFRMTRESFEKLLVALNCQEKSYIGGESPVTTEQSLLVTIWWLGKGETLLSISDRFNVAVSTVYNCTELMISNIIRIKDKYIVWPDRQEAVQIENNFKARAGYPGIIGAIDGCNIHFKCPEQHQESYIDKNMKHSIKLQGVVTPNKIFTNINCGFPGSAHDSRVFQDSKIFSNPHDYFYDYHLVGDKAYPLKTWIMTPYKDYRNLNLRQRHHNLILSTSIVVVEHTFGILKARWKILKYINMNSVEKSIKVIAACCILHNFCYVNSDFWDTYEPVQIHDDDNNNYDNQGGNGADKRTDIANYLWELHNN